MSHTFAKFRIPLQDINYPKGGRFTVAMPRGAGRFRLVPNDGLLFITALVDPEHPKEVRTFEIYPTGASPQALPPFDAYIGAAGANGEVWHLFGERTG